jgi:DNA-binding transcriptional regulator YiaG
MSLLSRLKEHAGPRVQVRVVPRVASGSPERLRLTVRGPDYPNVPSAAIALAKRHVPYARSHPAFGRLVLGEAVVLDVPVVEDLEALKGELEACGFTVARHGPPAEVDVRAIRERTGQGQEEFALRYGLDLEALRSWEDGRSEPDMAGRTLLALVARDADAVEALLAR